MCTLVQNCSTVAEENWRQIQDKNVDNEDAEFQTQTVGFLFLPVLTWHTHCTYTYLPHTVYRGLISGAIIFMPAAKKKHSLEECGHVWMWGKISRSFSSCFKTLRKQNIYIYTVYLCVCDYMSSWCWCCDNWTETEVRVLMDHFDLTAPSTSPSLNVFKTNRFTRGPLVFTVRTSVQNRRTAAAGKKPKENSQATTVSDRFLLEFCWPCPTLQMLGSAW